MNENHKWRKKGTIGKAFILVRSNSDTRDLLYIIVQFHVTYRHIFFFFACCCALLIKNVQSL